MAPWGDWPSAHFGGRTACRESHFRASPSRYSAGGILLAARCSFSITHAWLRKPKLSASACELFEPEAVQKRLGISPEVAPFAYLCLGFVNHLSTASGGRLSAASAVGGSKIWYFMRGRGAAGCRGRPVSVVLAT